MVSLIFVALLAFVIAYLGLLRTPVLMAEEYGSNISFFSMFVDFLHGILTGSLGTTPNSLPEYAGLPVTFVLTLLLPDTLQLIFVSLVLALVISIPLGSYAGFNKNSPGDFLARIYTFFFYSVPVIFVAFTVQLLFASGGVLGTGLPDTGPFTIGIHKPGFITFGITFPTHIPIIDGIVNGDFAFAWSSFEHLIMPAMVLGFWTSAAMSRFLRNEIVEHIGEPYVIAALARGIPRKEVLRRYVRRNSYNTFLTVTGPIFALLIGWVIITEIIFGYPGIGTFMIESVNQLFMAGLASCMLILGVALVVMNLAVDILYAVMDPRIRY